MAKCESCLFLECCVVCRGFWIFFSLCLGTLSLRMAIIVKLVYTKLAYNSRCGTAVKSPRKPIFYVKLPIYLSVLTSSSGSAYLGSSIELSTANRSMKTGKLCLPLFPVDHNVGSSHNNIYETINICTICIMLFAQKWQVNNSKVCFSLTRLWSSQKWIKNAIQL